MRRVADVLITDEGRDKGKCFLITELPAAQAEKWAMRALLLAAQAGVDVGNAKGMAGIAVAGIQAIMGLRFADVEPLMDEMFTCVQIRPDHASHDPNKAMYTRPLIETDIEEVLTRIKLREEVLKLHLGFSIADYLSTLGRVDGSAESSSSPPQMSRKRSRR
jgi:hypothetical protein